MGQVVVTGAVCMCSFGTAPGNMNVTSQTSVLVDNKPAATIQDCQMANITPFGMCTSLANPTVAAATAAALGVLTPQPCMLNPAGTWIPTQSKAVIEGKPVLTSDAKLMCAMGVGNISINSPGQTKTILQK